VLLGGDPDYLVAGMSIMANETPLTNDQRHDLWRARRDNTRKAPTASDDYAPSNGGAAFSPEDDNVIDCEESWWQACLGMIGLIVFLVALIVVAVFLADQIQAAPEPEERCFTNAIGETYCRTQHEWEVGDD
jgi:hypothetical protein